MKKIILSFLYIMLFSVFTQAQLAILDSEMQDVTNQTITINGNIEDILFKVDIFLHNTGEETIDVYARKIEVDLVDGVINYFCWNGTCFSEDVFDVEDPLLLGADQISRDTDFYTEFLTEGAEGLSEVRYEFFSETESFDTVYVNILLNLENPTRITDFHNRNSFHLAEPQPNPARGHTWINYSVPAGSSNAQIVIRNLLGKSVHTENVSFGSDRVRINTQNLNNGIYIYSLIVDNRLLESKRLVVAN